VIEKVWAVLSLISLLGCIAITVYAFIQYSKKGELLNWLGSFIFAALLSTFFATARFLPILFSSKASKTPTATEISAFALGHKYTVYCLKEITTWEDAKKYCEDRQGHLATITSQEENECLVQALSPSIEEAGIKVSFFGLKKLKDGEWEWCNEENFDYENWAEGEPNNMNDMESYGMFVWGDGERYKNGKWNDASFPDISTGENAFICEWDMED